MIFGALPWMTWTTEMTRLSIIKFVLRRFIISLKELLCDLASVILIWVADGDYGGCCI